MTKNHTQQGVRANHTKQS